MAKVKLITLPNISRTPDAIPVVDRQTGMVQFVEIDELPETMKSSADKHAVTPARIIREALTLTPPKTRKGTRCSHEILKALRKLQDGHGTITLDKEQWEYLNQEEKGKIDQYIASRQQAPEYWGEVVNATLDALEHPEDKEV